MKQRLTDERLKEIVIAVLVLGLGKSAWGMRDPYQFMKEMIADPIEGNPHFFDTMLDWSPSGPFNNDYTKRVNQECKIDLTPVELAQFAYRLSCDLHEIISKRLLAVIPDEPVRPVPPLDDCVGC